MLTALTNLTQYYVYLGRGPHGMGPACCTFAAMLLVLAHPTAILLKDLKIITPICATFAGKSALMACTYIGYILLFYAAMWGTNGFQAIHRAGSRCCCGGREDAP